jgi:drug/metabolite transporter (DMT)-like permease
LAWWSFRLKRCRRRAGNALLWALAAGLSYAVIVLYNRHAKTGALPLQSAWLQCCACALATLPWGYSAIRSADGETLLHVILIGVLCTGIAYSLLTFALQTSPQAKRRS